MMWLHKAIVTVFGLGYAPKAPGTFGALGAVFLLVIAMVLDLKLVDLPYVDPHFGFSRNRHLQYQCGDQIMG